MIDSLYTKTKDLYNLTTSSIATWTGRSVYAVTNLFDETTKVSALSKFVLGNLKGSPTNKKIVFCADGTWQTSQNDTNVYKIFKAIKPTPQQVVFYDNGVGTEGLPIEKVTGAAVGAGIFEKIKTGYNAIAQVYKPGDEIFLFGFSRGAYIARSLAGMISTCGLPKEKPDEKLIDKAFQAYRFPLLRNSILKDLSPYNLTETPIKMIGVWDTVGSLGGGSIFGKVGPLYNFLDPQLHSNIANAYHAIAIDEWRSQFPPTLWTPPSSPIPGQVLQQVWFPGSHGDVGGGYATGKTSDIPLYWMIKKAQALGLEMEPSITTNHLADINSAFEPIHNSWSAMWLWPFLRKIEPDSHLSNTVKIRSEHDKSYRPKNLAWEKGALAGSYKMEKVIPEHSSPLQENKNT